MTQEFISLFADVFDFVFFIIPIALPFIFIWFGISTFIEYKRKQYWNSIEWVLLEIIPPAEVERSPAAMEVFLLSLHQTSGEGDWHSKYIEGKFRDVFSLELISTGGRIQYFIRCNKKQRTGIESNLYAQFPGVEVFEAKEDYTDGFHFDPEKFEMHGAELKLVKPDPYPIKTYVDYKLDQETEHEYKVDPMSPVLEYLNTVKPKNNVWFQILVRAHKKEDLDVKKVFPVFSKRVDNWEETGKKEIKDLQDKGFIEIEDGEVKKKVKYDTPGQKNLIASLERSLSKYAFDIGIRCLAIAPKEDFDKGNKAMLGVWKQYSSLELNGFKPGYQSDFDWWYQDPFGKKLNKIKKEILEAYKTRNYFWKTDYKKRKREYFVLNTEELATIYHFLGKVSEAPSVSKVDARKSAPPSNLPI